MQRVKNVLSIIASLALSLPCACAFGLFLFEPAAAQTSDEPVVYLDQAWSQADREMYYQTSQGAQIIDYDIFLNLEAAGSQELFRSDANSDRYGLITQDPNPRTNPDALPVGLTKTVFTEGRWKGAQIGLTCAACHTAQLTYKGKRIRIDGGGARAFEFLAYVYGLDDALQATLTDAAKFDRLATRLGASSSDAKSELRNRFQGDAERVHQYRTRTAVAPTPWGPGRIDCLSLIANRLMAVLPGIPENSSTPIAPMKIPFVWNAPQGFVTQWSGTQSDPATRNLGEAEGVFMSIDLRSKTPEEGLFDSSAAVRNEWKIEDTLWRLAPPKWPEEILGKIDRQKALEGKALFTANCASCHNSYPYTWTAPNKYGKRFIEVGMVPQKYVGTDPSQFQDAQWERPYALTAQLSGQMPPPYQGKEIMPTTVFFATLRNTVTAKALEQVQVNLTEAEAADLHGYRELPVPTPILGLYKAGPRDGVWATPPFLHNGSVPNLYEMLLPANERTKKFYIGREFDPVKVGVDTSGKSGTFLLDTSLPGNSNAGHSFEDGPRGNGVVGPLLTEAQRWAIVEYLKSIFEEAGRVTPYGGPPDAVTGHGAWSQP
jgi:hypothetical protein